MVGRLAEGERHKGHDEVLEAWPRIHRELPAARLVVVGEGDDRERLEGKARRLDVAGSVDFRGFVPDAELDALYGSCRALVLPSRGEGFGLVYLEAMRHGRPCVAALGGPAEEIFEDSVSGLLVDPGDPEELHAALAGLLESPALADRLGRAALETYRERHSMEVFRSRFHPLLEAMLERLRD
jgi:phosphatidylinositol alpha-1,6-mannosyltransferase